MKWKDYEIQVFNNFRAKYSDCELLLNQKKPGRYSKTLRQIDILVKGKMADIEVIGIFDCKCFSKKINVRVVDTMIGFIDDIGANFGGVVSQKGFSVAAKNRALAAKIDLRVIPFESPETVIDQFVPSLDFSDPRNSMYLAVI